METKEGNATHRCELADAMVIEGDYEGLAEEVAKPNKIIDWRDPRVGDMESRRSGYEEGIRSVMEHPQNHAQPQRSEPPVDLAPEWIKERERSERIATPNQMQKAEREKENRLWLEQRSEQEWTPESLATMLDEYGVIFTAKAINAALAAAYERDMEAQPQRSEQEWTPVYERNAGLWYVCDPQEPVIDLGFDEQEARAIVDAHNAALAAERIHIKAEEEKRRADIHKGLTDALAKVKVKEGK